MKNFSKQNLSELLFLVTLLLVLGLTTYVFHLGKIDFGQVMYVFLLGLTAMVISKQAFATEKLAEYQIMPAIDVKMFYSVNYSKTCFLFSNSSSTPAFVSILVDGKKTQDVFGRSLRIAPLSKRYTQWFYLLGKQLYAEGDRVVLSVIVKPAFDDSHFELTFTKSYKLHNNQWDEETWGVPD